MTEKTSCCCSDNKTTDIQMNKYWIIGKIDTPAGEIPQVSTMLTSQDKLGAIKVRCAIGRNNYTITPGLYAIGAPTAESSVFVSANYKLSFDHLRQALNGILSGSGECCCDKGGVCA